MDGKVPAIWKWALILLLLCNMGLIATMWFRPGMHKGPKPETPRDFVIRELKFSDEQVKKYDVLIQDHQRSMRQLRDDAMKLRQQLFSQLKNGSGAGINTDSLAQLIAGNQKQIELVTYNHFGQVRALCSDAQKADFDKIIEDVVQKMNGPGRGGPPPHDGPPPPRDGDHGDGPPPPPAGGPPPPPDGR